MIAFIIRSEFLLVTTHDLSAVSLQFKPHPQSAISYVQGSWQIGTDVLTLLGGDVIIRQEDALFTFDWNVSYDSTE